MTLPILPAAFDLDALIGSSWLREHGLPIVIILSVAYLIRSFGSLVVKRLIRQAMNHRPFPTPGDRKKRISTLNSISGTSLNILTFIIGGLMVINELGVNTSPILASAGFISLTIGFGAQALIRDFMAGLFITAENQYRVGDIVELQTSVSRIKGTVEHVTTRATVLRDTSGYIHHVPNGGIITSTNKTMDYRYLNEEITVDRRTDLKKLEHIINHIGEELVAIPEFEHYLRQPLKMQGITRLDDNGLSVRIRGKISPGNTDALKSELFTRLNTAFIKHSIKLTKHIEE